MVEFKKYVLSNFLKTGESFIIDKQNEVEFECEGEHYFVLTEKEREETLFDILMKEFEGNDYELDFLAPIIELNKSQIKEIKDDWFEDMGYAYRDEVKRRKWYVNGHFFLNWVKRQEISFEDFIKRLTKKYIEINDVERWITNGKEFKCNDLYIYVSKKQSENKYFLEMVDNNISF